MKVLLCLMATVATCNAGLLTGLGGGSSANQIEVQVEPQQLQHVGQVQHVQQVQHIAPVPQQQVKIIKIQNLGSSSGYSGGHGGGGYSYGSGGYSGGASYSQPQIIKVIHERAPSSPASGYAVQGYSSGHSSSYAPNYSSYSLESILPQILKIIYEDSGSLGGYQQGSAYIGPLIDVYGTSGHAIITKGGNSNDYLRSGHVVEKGHLEVVQVNRQNRGGNIGGGGGGLGGGLSSLFRGKW